MKSSDMMPIIAAAITGLFLLIGYVVQKTLEHRRAMADKKLETYSMFLKSLFDSMQSRMHGDKVDNSAEVFWKSQISLFASDDVVHRFGEFNALLPTTPQAKTSSTDKLAIAFDALLLAMRRDISTRSKVTVDDLRRISPLHNT
jgi:hypothetical protein